MSWSWRLPVWQLNVGLGVDGECKQVKQLDANKSNSYKQTKHGHLARLLLIVNSSSAPSLSPHNATPIPGYRPAGLSGVVRLGHCSDLQGRCQREGVFLHQCRPNELQDRLLLCGMLRHCSVSARHSLSDRFNPAARSISTTPSSDRARR